MVTSYGLFARKIDANRDSPVRGSTAGEIFAECARIVAAVCDHPTTRQAGPQRRAGGQVTFDLSFAGV